MEGNKPIFLFSCSYRTISLLFVSCNNWILAIVSSKYPKSNSISSLNFAKNSGSAPGVEVVVVEVEVDVEPGADGGRNGRAAQRFVSRLKGRSSTVSGRDLIRASGSRGWLLVGPRLGGCWGGRGD